jgi:hypothetical protein
MNTCKVCQNCQNIDKSNLTDEQKYYSLGKCVEVCVKCKQSDKYIKDLEKKREKYKPIIKLPGACRVCQNCQNIDKSNLTNEQKYYSLGKCVDICEKCDQPDKKYIKDLKKKREKYKKKKFLSYFRKENTCEQKCDLCQNKIFNDQNLVFEHAATLSDLVKKISQFNSDMPKIKDCILTCERCGGKKEENIAKNMRESFRLKHQKLIEGKKSFDSIKT